MTVNRFRRRPGALGGVVIGAILAFAGPLGVAVGFHSNPVGRESHPRPDPDAPIVVTKRADHRFSRIGELNGYTIRVSNPRPRPVRLSDVVDTLPSGFSYEAGSATGMTTAEPEIAGRRLTWDGPFVVPSGTAASLHFEVRTAGEPGDYFNVATVSGAGLDIAPTGPTALVVVRAPTSLSAEPAIADLRDGVRVTLELSARLTWAGGPLAGKWVDFFSGFFFLCTARTNEQGIATCGNQLDAALAVTGGGYRAAFSGDDHYFSSFADGDLVGL